MDIFKHHQKDIDKVRIPDGSSTITLVLDESITRMCIRYELKPVPFMLKCLEDELHKRAFLDGVRKQVCPYCGGKH
jgi:hypothetical protein